MISGFRVCYTIMLGPKEAVTTNYIDPCITPPCFPGRGYSKGVQNRAGRNSMQMDKPPSAQIVLGRNPCALPISPYGGWQRRDSKDVRKFAEHSRLSQSSSIERPHPGPADGRIYL